MCIRERGIKLSRKRCRRKLLLSYLCKHRFFYFDFTDSVEKLIENGIFIWIFKKFKLIIQLIVKLCTWVSLIDRHKNIRDSADSATVSPLRSPTVLFLNAWKCVLFLDGVIRGCYQNIAYLLFPFCWPLILTKSTADTVFHLYCQSICPTHMTKLNKCVLNEWTNEWMTSIPALVPHENLDL